METYLSKENKIRKNFYIPKQYFKQTSLIFLCCNSPLTFFLKNQDSINSSDTLLMKLECSSPLNKFFIEVFWNCQVSFIDGQFLLNDIIYEWDISNPLFVNNLLNKNTRINIFIGDCFNNSFVQIPLHLEDCNFKTASSKKSNLSKKEANVNFFNVENNEEFIICFSNVGKFNKQILKNLNK